MKKLFVCLLFIKCSSPVLHKEEKAPAIIKEIKSAITSEYNSKIVFYIDLSKSSTDYRFFVIRMKDSMIVNKGLCCNGRTDSYGNVIYSNAPGSNCSSKGIYSIGSSYTGRFGKAYKLYGLSSTNSNAYKRCVVLHSYWGIPRTAPTFTICKSYGCPTVNPDYLKELSEYIDKSKKPILLIIK